MAKGSGGGGRGGAGGAGSTAAAPAAASAGGGISGQALVDAPLAEFANIVQRIADANPNNIFDNRILIYDAWRIAQSRGSTITLEQFKDRLITADRQRLINLSRIDLAYAIPDQRAVAASIIPRGTTVVHSIRR